MMTTLKMFTELLYPLQRGYTPLHLAVFEGHTTCIEHLLSTPDIDVKSSGNDVRCPLMIIKRCWCINKQM